MATGSQVLEQWARPLLVPAILDAPNHEVLDHALDSDLDSGQNGAEI
jgi:hypothetical protein